MYKKSPTAVKQLGIDVRSDIQVYLNVSPFVDSAFTAQAVHVRFCVLAGHSQAGKLPVIP